MTVRAILVSSALTAPVMAAPGDALPWGGPELKARAIPEVVTPAPSGKVLIGGGFTMLDGREVGDRLLLDTEHGEIREPVPGWLSRGDIGTPPWFPLASGDWLVPGADGGWLRHADGSAVVAGLGEEIRPQFEREQFLWVIRRDATGSRCLGKRDLRMGGEDPAFLPGVDWPADPLSALPAGDGKVWVLGGTEDQGFPLLQMEEGPKWLFRIDDSGFLDREFPAVPLAAHRTARLFPRPDGGFGVETGPDLRAAYFWPAPGWSAYRIDWLSSEGATLRTLNLALPVMLGGELPWAESLDGDLVVPHQNGDLVKRLQDGSLDGSFVHSGGVRSVIALPDGKWLINGIHRLLPDGKPDGDWRSPDLERPANVRELHALPDGRVLAVGDFDRVGGFARKGLALFDPEGNPDASFAPDGALGEIRTATVSGDGIYVITRRPLKGEVGHSSRLVGLTPAGAVDRVFPWDNDGSGDILTISGHQDGAVLVVGGSALAGVGSWTLSRHLPDGSADPFFRTLRYPAPPPRLVVLSNGNFVVGDTIHAADGTVLRRLGGILPLEGLCEWQGGVLFAESFGSNGRRLRLWRAGHWIPLAAPALDASWDVSVVPGGNDNLYLRAAFLGEGGAVLRRIGWIGRTDATFRAAPLIRRIRRTGDHWKESGTDGFLTADLQDRQRTVLPEAMLWHPTGGRLWTGGDFDRAGDVDCDGLAWIDGSGGERADELPDAYDAWEAGFGLPAGSREEDTDGDGLPNAIEFAVGGDPWSRTAAPEVVVEDRRFVLRYPRSTEGSVQPLIVEFSGDLVNWTPVVPGMNAAVTVAGGTADSMIEEVTLPHLADGRKFVRLRAGE